MHLMAADRVLKLQLEEDVENYTRLKMIGGRLLLKKGVLPHKFQCQGKHEARRRAAANKRDHHRNIQEALASHEVSGIEQLCTFL